MRLVIQRVKRAQVDVAGLCVGSISTGILVLVGVSSGDTLADVLWCADKLVNVRIFPNLDAVNGMETSLLDVGGAALLVSQFTLMGSCVKGRRPTWTLAAKPDVAENLYMELCNAVRVRGIDVAMGRFRTDMEVSLTDWGPVTLILESPQKALGTT